MRKAEAGSRAAARVVARAVVRSEEHTSELQSRGQLVCRLMLEKKNMEINAGTYVNTGVSVVPDTVRRPQWSTLFPYTTLFRSAGGAGDRVGAGGDGPPLGDRRRPCRATAGEG